ncbi:transcriptional regulator [Cenarchaeum symbiosum A]|uniref:Transcriptional regulator n=1 Tax=Cenarchaeum symbiosum (strain A) TaxID=414004 RepID=A0RUS6_CENSY|nr:transcriptional regulator [Cenarchaeum symbiosum A]
MELGMYMRPMSHTEQKLYLYLESMSKNIFRLPEIEHERLGLSRGHYHTLISRLVKKGWIKRAGHGTYLRNPPLSVRAGPYYIEDPFETGLKMYGGYIAFHTAMYLYGLNDNQPVMIYVATPSKSETVDLGPYHRIKAVKMGRRFTGIRTKDKYRISTLMKTIFDCFDHVMHSGGYPDLLKSITFAESYGFGGSLDWNEFEVYLDEFASSSLCQKIGYMLSLLKEEGIYETPDDLMEYLRGRIKNKTNLFGGRLGGKYDRNWMVVDNIGRRALLSWHYHG